MGNPRLLTAEALETVGRCPLLVGAGRLLDAFPDGRAQKEEAATPEKIAGALRAWNGRVEEAAVLVSGDTGFYSAAKKLPGLLPEMDVRFYPGISSLQYFCARLGTGWDDVRVVSLHGRDGEIAAAARQEKKVFVLTGGANTVGSVCETLAENGLGALRVAVGADLSYGTERVEEGDAAGFAGREFPSMSVMLIENPAPQAPPAGCGLPDAAFIRGKTPMTKMELRAVSLAKLELRRGQILWDVGAGTGSVSVEAARMLEKGRVYAVEKDEAALELLRQNQKRFGCENLRIHPGEAPAALEGLPVPDALFVGGSSGNLRDILAAALEKNPKVRVVVNAVTLETVSAGLQCFQAFSLPDQDIVQVAVTRTRAAGRVHMLDAQNPVFVMSAGGNHE